MTRRLYSIRGNTQRLDGGAMFGNAPRALWESWSPPDERNRIELATRALLVHEGDRLVLVEAGVGAFLPPHLKERYGVEGEANVLLEGLDRLGLSDADVGVVVLTHLHFDHAGGVLSDWSPERPPHLRFPNATFVVGRDQWDRARAPHPRDRASFIPELQELLEASGRLELVGPEGSPTLGPDWRFVTSHGHTPGMLVPWVEGERGPVVFGADLIPGRAWVHTSITMGYDRFPELLVDEKRALLEDLAARDGRVFFTHDPVYAMAHVTRDERGRFGTGNLKRSVRGFVA